MKRRNFFKALFYSLASAVGASLPWRSQASDATEHVRKVGFDLVAQTRYAQAKCQTASEKTTCKTNHLGDCATWHVCKDHTGHCQNYVNCPSMHWDSGRKRKGK